MQRWHLTTALAATTVGAALLAPRLGTGPRASHVEPPPIAEVEVGAQARDGISLSAELDQPLLPEGQSAVRHVVIEVQAAAEGGVRQPVHVAVVMDQSGSMAAMGKMEAARAAASELVGRMESGDSFSLVTFSNRSRTLIPSAPVYDPYALRQLISTITPDGGTNISDGLQDGFAQLERQRGVKRLLLLSDGNANMGISDAGGLRRMAASQVGAGVSVSTMGMGLEYNEDLLAAMADGGGGQYRYIAHPSQLPAMFNEELRQLGAAVAQRATVELDLPEGAQLLEVYGYEAERSGEDCTIFLGDLIAGQSRKVVARVSLPASAAEELKVAAVQLRWADLERGALHELEVGVGARTSEDLTAVQGTWNRASARKATEAQAADLLDQGARSWEQGDQAGSYSQISEAAEMLERQAQALGYLDLQGEAERYRSTNATIQAAPMGSAEGLHNMKSTKEAARAAAR